MQNPFLQAVFWVCSAAQSCARQCGILTEGGLALEGPQFRVMPEHELVNLLPRLQVHLLSHPCCSFWPLIFTYRPGHVLYELGWLGRWALEGSSARSCFAQQMAAL
jgi:hypothetical protein